ncbi:hypothetical protein [Sphingomonas sp. VL_57B]|jgi:hypothetical protein|uniref:hypothetical protein n=1 Tax=unclassified Sphingomonas TaxID=196159 RepID=UPI0031F520A0
MFDQQLNSLVLGRAAGSSFGLSSTDLGRLSIIAYMAGNPLLAIIAARSMADKPSDECAEDDDVGEMEDAVEAAQAAAEDAEAAKGGAEAARKGAEAAAQEAKIAADAAGKSAAAAQQAADDASKAAAQAREPAKAGAIAPPLKK